MGIYPKSGDSSQDCSESKQKGRKWAKSNNKLSGTDKCVKKATTSHNGAFLWQFKCLLMLLMQQSQPVTNEPEENVTNTR